MALSGAQVTQHGLAGYSQILYGDFSGKAAAANSAPTDISLSKAYVLVTSGVDAVVGALSATDPDAGDTHTFTLVAGTGDTNNASFNISGSSLRCSDPGALGVGTYSVRVRATDSAVNTYDEAFAISVRDASSAALPSATLIGSLISDVYQEVIG